VIVTASDSNERSFEQLLVMLMSLRENSPEDYVTVHLVDCDKSHEEAVKKVHPSAFIETASCPEGVDKRGFMVCYRASAVLKAVMTDNNVAWFDADTIIRRDLDDFWKGVERGCLKILMRGGAQERSIFQAGVFAVGRSPEILEMLKWWDSKVSGVNEWYADQLWLYRAWDKFSNKVKLVFMPMSCNNVGDSTKEKPFLEASMVWHCKSSHFNHPDYQKEYMKYAEKLR